MKICPKSKELIKEPGQNPDIGKLEAKEEEELSISYKLICRGLSFKEGNSPHLLL